jgi:hypothetical protein
MSDLKALCCQGIDGPCYNHATVRRQNTTYNDDEKNWVRMCDTCFQTNQENWSIMWTEFNGSRQ